MIKKRVLVIITEGETDEEFYKEVISTIKKVNNGINFQNYAYNLVVNAMERSVKIITMKFSNNAELFKICSAICSAIIYKMLFFCQKIIVQMTINYF